eukprot:GHVR01154570.1.p1 GENE.GHVR01154570.1~~GHVR01154570.1.p1  ORF type:complete len:1360 (+),score=396.55 GHVR01154570.1:288-4082(+)
MLRCITQREYIVLSPTTAHALQNSFIEVLFILVSKTKKENNNNNSSIQDIINKQSLNLIDILIELSKILNILRWYTIGIYDEIDITYNPKTENNYPLKERTSPSPLSLPVIGLLYQFLTIDLNINFKYSDDLYNIYNDDLKPKLIIKATEILINTPSLNEIICIKPIDNKLCYDNIYLFLNNEYGNIEVAQNMLKLNMNDGFQILAIIHLQLWEFFLQVLKSSVNLNYGRSKTRPEYALPIPYSSANTPNERSEYANRWELINKSFVLYLVDGVSFSQAQHIIIKIQQTLSVKGNEGGVELWAQLIKHNNSIGSGSGSGSSDENNNDNNNNNNNDNNNNDINKLDDIDRQLLDPISLDIHNKEVVLRFLYLYNNGDTPTHKKYKIQYVIEEVLPYIDTPKKQIFSNPQNLSSMLRVTQGYSGTIDNSFILPHSVYSLYHFSKRLNGLYIDVGGNGKILYKLLQNKSKIVDVSNELDINNEINPKLVMMKVMSITNNNYSAIIDVGAVFKSFSNYETAVLILESTKQIIDTETHKVINDVNKIASGVLYFDESTSTLRALLRGSNIPLLINGTRKIDITSIVGDINIYKRLITYYDQRHTTGTDIDQPLFSTALLLNSYETSLRDILQGIMRMRLFLTTQNIDIGVTGKTYVKTLEDNKTGNVSIVQLLKHAQIVQYLQIQTQNKQIVIQKMSDTIRQGTLDLLLYEINICAYNYNNEIKFDYQICINKVLNIFDQVNASAEKYEYPLFIREFKENWGDRFTREQVQILFIDYLKSISKIIINTATTGNLIQAEKKHNNKNKNNIYTQNGVYLSIPELQQILDAHVEVFPMPEYKIYQGINSTGGSLHDADVDVEIETETEIETESQVEMTMCIHSSNPNASYKQVTPDKNIIKLIHNGYEYLSNNIDNNTYHTLPDALTAASQHDNISNNISYHELFKLTKIYVHTSFMETVDRIDSGDISGVYRKRPSQIVLVSSDKERLASGVLLSQSDTAILIANKKEDLKGFVVLLSAPVFFNFFNSKWNDNAMDVRGLFSRKLQFMQAECLIFDGELSILDLYEWRYIVKLLLVSRDNIIQNILNYYNSGTIYLNKDRTLSLNRSYTMKLLRDASVDVNVLKFDDIDVQQEELFFKKRELYAVTRGQIDSNPPDRIVVSGEMPVWDDHLLDDVIQSNFILYCIGAVIGVIIIIVGCCFCTVRARTTKRRNLLRLEAQLYDAAASQAARLRTITASFVRTGGTTDSEKDGRKSRDGEKDGRKSRGGVEGA